MRVLIVENQPESVTVLVEAVELGLATEEIDLAGDIVAAKQKIGLSIYDFVLLDVVLADGNELDLIEKIKKRNEHAIIIITTSYVEGEYGYDVLRLGVNGLLLKNNSAKEIALFLQSSLPGYLLLSPDFVQLVLSRFSDVGQKDLLREPGIEYEVLTNREKEIFVLVAKGLSVKEVGCMLDIANNTVAAHIKNIYKKLNLHNRSEATAMAVAMNLYKP